MGVSTLIVVDDVHLRIVLNAIDEVFAWGMKANLHRLECLFLSWRQVQNVFPLIDIMLKVWHLNIVFGYEVVLVFIPIQLHSVALRTFLRLEVNWALFLAWIAQESAYNGCSPVGTSWRVVCWKFKAVSQVSSLGKTCTEAKAGYLQNLQPEIDILDHLIWFVIVNNI